MKLKNLLLITTGAALAAPMAFAQDMADTMTAVSWGGAYQTSQIRAYADPYVAANPEVTIVWDESSAEAVARLRAMNEANNITWDLVDVVASIARPSSHRRRASDATTSTKSQVMLLA